MNNEEAAYQDMCDGLAWEEQQGNADAAEAEHLKMKRFRVKYTVLHVKEFWVPDQSTVESVLNEMNACKIIEIEELPEFDINETNK